MQNQRQILWGPTMQVNGIRLLCSAIVWFIIFAVTDYGDGPWVALTFPLIYIPIAGLGILFGNTTIGGLLKLSALIIILPADPVMFVLRLIAPRLIIMDHYLPLMLAFFLYIHDGV